MSPLPELVRPAPRRSRRTVPKGRPVLGARTKSGLTVLVPAYNEEASIADTVRSLLAQTLPAEEIVVIDDCSTDRTADIARSLGVTVLQPPQNTGTKAGAQNYALQFVTTPFTMAVDGDTTLEPDAIELLLAALDDPKVAAACGYVIPRHRQTLWERGRYIEYLMSFTFYKPVQDYYEKPLISSGCFSVYRTEILKANGGWQTRTMAEDMDLTWSFYEQGHKVRFVPEAVCYPIEPHDLKFMRKQLKRWSHGFAQNVKLHWRGLVHIPYLRSIIAVALWDAVFASVLYLMLLPVLAIAFAQPLFLLGYLIDLPVVLVPTLYAGWKRGEVLLVLKSMPGFFLLRTLNAVHLMSALWREFVTGNSLRVYEKGH